jgi:hypothetical protein
MPNCWQIIISLSPTICRGEMACLLYAETTEEAPGFRPRGWSLSSPRETCCLPRSVDTGLRRPASLVQPPRPIPQDPGCHLQSRVATCMWVIPHFLMRSCPLLHQHLLESGCRYPKSLYPVGQVQVKVNGRVSLAQSSGEPQLLRATDTSLVSSKCSTLHLQTA